MKYTLLSTLAFSLILLSACKSSEMGSTDVVVSQPEVSFHEMLIADHIAAMGGMDAISKVSSIKATGEVFMPAMDMTLLMTTYKKAPGKLRVEVDIPQMGAKIINGYNGEVAWESNPMAGGAAKLGGDRTRSFREQADMDGYLIGAMEDGFEVTYEGVEQIKDKSNHKLKLMRPDSTQLFIYIDQDTKLETMIEAEGPNPMTGMMSTVQTYFYDYRNVGGSPQAYRMEVVVGGETFQTITFDDYRINVPVNDSLFEFPGE